MNNTSISMRAFRSLQQNPSPKLFCFKVFRELIFGYITFLNKRRVTRITRNAKRVVKEINGSKMFLDATMDDGLCRYLIVADVREAYITETMKHELLECNIVVDIGANVGCYALLEAKMLGDSGKVYAIEPVPETIDLLKENIRLNDYKNIEVHQLAIGDRTGNASMYVGNWLNRSQIKEVGSIDSKRISHEISTRISTLDDFLQDKPYPDIIRMDVEGYEYNIINGMKRTLKKKSPLRLFLEFHFRFLKKEKCMELLRCLKSAGFEISDATYEVDEKCITHGQLLGDVGAYLNSKLNDLPEKGHINISIEDILTNTPIWKNEEGAFDLCMRLGTLEILFKRT